MHCARSIRCFWPAGIFLLFSLFIIGLFLNYAPSWGFMDDIQNLRRAETVFQGDSVVRGIIDLSIGDMRGWGIFKPVYYTWAVLTYHFFKESPLTIYILIVIFNMLTLALWGYALHDLLAKEEGDRWWHIFVFPLSFLIFTPFWNNFIYISVQQKFIVTLSALAILSFLKSYQRENKVYVFLTYLCLLLSVGVHPEGIFLALAFVGCTLLDLLTLRKRRKISLIHFIVSILIFIGYFVFSLTVQMQGSYSGQYKGGLNLSAILGRLSNASVALKGIIFMALVALGIACLKGFSEKEISFKKYAILPLGVISYIAVLTPWGFPNYHLSTLAPFVLGILFPLYLYLNKRSRGLFWVNHILIIALAFAACTSIGAPRVAKMAHKKQVNRFIQKHRKSNPNSLYFTSPPLVEATAALRHFTEAEFVYLKQRRLSSARLLEGRNHYLVFCDESGDLTLQGIRVGDAIYANDTWRIFELKRQNNYRKTFNVEFKENYFQKLVSFLKRSF